MLCTLLALSVLAPAAELPQEDPSQFDGPSSPALRAQSEGFVRGTQLLKKLEDHLTPPRNLAVAEVAAEVTSFSHSARPLLHRTGAIERTASLHQMAGLFRNRFPTEREWWLIHTTEGAPGTPADELERRTLTDDFADNHEGASPSDDLRLRMVSCAPCPYVLVQWARHHGTVTGVSTAEAETHVRIDVAGGRIVARLGGTPDVPALLGFDWCLHHPLYGDVVESLTYALDPGPAPGIAAGWSIAGPLGTGESAQVTGVGTADLEPKMVERSAFHRWPDSESLEIRVPQKVAEDLWAVELPDYDARVLALDTAGGWILMEAPVASNVGRAIEQSLSLIRMDQAVSHVLVSHHHPHYIGGLRPFVAAGAKVVCPEGVRGYVEHVLGRPRSIRPDRLSQSDAPIEVIGVPEGGRWSPEGMEDRILALEFGEASGHTDAFMTFLLPQHRVAFGGDLLWVPEDAEVARRSPRTAGLLDAIQGSGVEIDRVLTSWPVTHKKIGGLRWRSDVSLQEIEASLGTPR